MLNVNLYKSLTHVTRRISNDKRIWITVKSQLHGHLLKFQRQLTDIISPTDFTVWNVPPPPPNGYCTHKWDAICDYWYLFFAYDWRKRAHWHWRKQQRQRRSLFIKSVHVHPLLFTQSVQSLSQNKYLFATTSHSFFKIKKKLEADWGAFCSVKPAVDGNLPVL